MRTPNRGPACRCGNSVDGITSRLDNVWGGVRVFGRITAALLAATTVFAIGCGTGDAPPTLASGDQTDNGDVTSAEFRVVLGNALSDTLTGNAGFATVIEPDSRQYRFVIRLATGFDFAGGIIFARTDTTLPEAGQYDLQTATDTLTAANPREFAMLYREGMLRELHATSGTLTLSAVTDTLITGTFDATLRGSVANLNLEGRTAEVHAAGRFRADRDVAAYVVGL